MADHNGGEGRGLQKLLQPLDGGQVQMVRGLVQQQDVGLLHQCFGDSEPLSPSAGERVAVGVKILEAGAAERLSQARLPLVGWNGGALERGFDHRAHGLRRRQTANPAARG